MTTKCPTCRGPYSLVTVVCLYCGAPKEGETKEVSDGGTLVEALEVIDSNIDLLDSIPTPTIGNTLYAVWYWYLKLSSLGIINAVMGLKPPRKLDMTAFNILSRNIERNISATRILGGGESRTEQRLRTLEQQLKDVRKRGMLAGKWQRNTLLAIPAFFLLYFAASAVMVLLLNYGSGVKDIPDAFISKWQHSSSEQILILTADGVLLDNTAYPYTFSGIKILGQRRLEIKLLLPTQGSCAGGASLLDQNTLIMTLGSAYYNGNPDAEGIRFCTEVLSGSYSRN